MFRWRRNTSQLVLWSNRTLVPHLTKTLQEKTCRPVSLKGKDVKRKNPYQNINKSNPLFIIYLYMPNCNQVRLTPSMQGWYIFHKSVKLITLREYRLTLEHRFELLGSTYTQIFFNSKYYSTVQSVVGWILQYAGTADTRNPVHRWADYKLSIHGFSASQEIRVRVGVPKSLCCGRVSCKWKG